MVKERLTITLDKEVLKEVAATIDAINVRNRSHAIEKLLKTALMQKTPKKAVVLAGGVPVRFENKPIPKPMVLVDGKPIMEYVLQALSKIGVNDVIVVAGENAEEITGYFGNGSSLGLKITYLVEEKRRGTEGALALAKGLAGSDPFFVINGDNLYLFDLLEVYKQHINTQASVTIALTTAEKATGFGVTKLDGFKVVAFSEKPEETKNQLVSTGLYVFSSSVFDMLAQSEKPVMLEDSLFPKLAIIGKLYGYVVSEGWIPLDSSNISGSIKAMSKYLHSKRF